MSGRVVVLRGDAAHLPLGTASIDAVVCDPPYGLEFMGREWDTFKPSAARIRERVDGRTNPAAGKSTDPDARGVAGPVFQRWCEAWARECLRVLKPGGYLLAFGGTRTWHRLVCGIEDAGFEIRDSAADLTGREAAGLMWTYGSGFPKSLDVSKAIDKAAGAAREVVGAGRWAGRESAADLGVINDDSWQGGAARIETAPATDDAARWEGWGTALKPGWEPIAVARKPLAGTVAQNVLAYGTGALNIDGCRTSAGQDYRDKCASVVGLASNRNGDAYGEWTGERADSAHDAGRWPPNVLLSEEAAAEMDRQSGISKSPSGVVTGGRNSGGIVGTVQAGARRESESGHGDQGGASRFFPVFRPEYEQMCVLYGMLSVCEHASGAVPASPQIGQQQDAAASDASASSLRRGEARPDRSMSSAHTAASLSGPTPATIPSSAHATAPTRPSDWNVLRVKSAGSLCGSCATAIAQSLAATQRGQSPMPTLGLLSTDAFSERILTQNLALFAEALASSATTSTTTALTTSLGCVVAAISACTTRESDSPTRKSGLPAFKYSAKADTASRPRLPDGTAWPTVKPVSLMSWLLRLVTPPGGTVLDPFAGTGTTGEAAILEGFDAILMDKNPQAIALTRVRLAKPMQPAMFAPEPAAEPASARPAPPPQGSLFDLDGAA